MLSQYSPATAVPVSDVMLFESDGAGTNESTLMGFEVPIDTFEREVQALRDAGVEVLTFDMDGVSWDDGVGTVGDVKGVRHRGVGHLPSTRRGQPGG